MKSKQRQAAAAFPQKLVDGRRNKQTCHPQCPCSEHVTTNMVNGTAKPPGLAFSRETFAKLTPAPFLHAHLQQPEPIRPNGRSLDAFSTPTIHTGSLSHSNGSAVVRLGDTAVVCGVRAEILLASDIPHPPGDDISEDDLVERLGLLVPNVELSTGCSPDHLPGSPPSKQSLSMGQRCSSRLRGRRGLTASRGKGIYCVVVREGRN